jgi:quercetin dioxygenase-like cupin family protein
MGDEPAQVARKSRVSKWVDERQRGGTRTRYCPWRLGVEMNSSAAIFLLGALGLVQLSSAQSTSPLPILPESLVWFSPPGNPWVKGAWVLGSEHEHGMYALRVTLRKGGKLPVHTHPDTRLTTVLSGTLYVGFGASEDESDMIAVPAGGAYVAPAHQSHYVWARDDDVVYQEGGVGPTATLPAS